MPKLTRRDMMMRSAMLGCSLAANPLVTPITLAAGPWDNRLVVIILRGGMDGLDVVRPIGDSAYATARGKSTDGLALDGFFELNPGFAGLHPLWASGELSFVHATSTPYRDKRSHFDGQDHLEAGFSTADLGPVRDGWLNRLLQTQSGLSSDVAFSIGQGEMLITRGAASISNWTPEVDLLMSPQALHLASLVMQNDPLFQATFEEAVQIAESDGDAVMSDRGGQSMETMSNGREKGEKLEEAIAKFAASRLRQDTRIAAFSINGWDSHQNQPFLMRRSLPRLANAILTLKRDLGPIWQKTTVLAMTEFGRTVRMNGTRGTDHGTGGALLIAGGTLSKSQIAGRWPGLSEDALYMRRDLMPTSDVRAHAAWALRRCFGLDQSVLETQVFPGLAMQDDLGLLA